MTAAAEWDDVAEFTQMRACREAYRRLGDAIHEVLGARGAIEFGCGVADHTERLFELGWDVTALERSDVARKMARVRSEPFDLISSDAYPWAAPVSICTETAEHIPDEYSHRVADHVQSCARWRIVWSAAQPGQEWPGHVNLQPASYWLEKFAAYGWTPDEEQTLHLRLAMRMKRAQHEYCADNFHILRRA
jgi:hypothetical protein